MQTSPGRTPHPGRNAQVSWGRVIRLIDFSKLESNTEGSRMVVDSLVKEGVCWLLIPWSKKGVLIVGYLVRKGGLDASGVGSGTERHEFSPQFILKKEKPGQRRAP